MVTLDVLIAVLLKTIDYNEAAEYIIKTCKLIIMFVGASLSIILCVCIDPLGIKTFSFISIIYRPPRC